MENFADLTSICVHVFNAVKSVTLIFVVPLFLGRIVFSSVIGEGDQALKALKGAAMYFMLIATFPYILEILFSIPEAYLPQFSTVAERVAPEPRHLISSIPFVLDKIMEVLLSALYWCVYYLHVFFILMMCSMAPIVFLTSTLLGVGLGIEVFMGLLIIGSSWPIIWFGFDQVHTSLVGAQSDAFGARCLELVLTVFKGLSPMAFASLALKSPAGKMITQAVKGAVATANFAVKGPLGLQSGGGPMRFVSSGRNSSRGSSYDGKKRSKPKSEPPKDRLSKAKTESAKQSTGKESSKK